MDIDISKFTDDIYNLTKYILNYFTIETNNDSGIKDSIFGVDNINDYNKYTKENLEILYKSHYRKNNEYKDIIYYFGKIEKDNIGNYKFEIQMNNETTKFFETRNILYNI